MNASNSEHNVVFRALDYISFRWFWIFVNANLVHKFPITDEEYNHVEGSVLNVKQKVACVWEMSEQEWPCNQPNPKRRPGYYV